MAKHSTNIFCNRKGFVRLCKKVKDGIVLHEGGILRVTALDLIAERLNARDERRERKYKRFLEAQEELLNGPEQKRLHAV